MVHEYVRFIGLDVDKDSIIMSVVESGTAEAMLLGTFPNDINKVFKQLKNYRPTCRSCESATKRPKSVPFVSTAEGSRQQSSPGRDDEISD